MLKSRTFSTLKHMLKNQHYFSTERTCEEIRIPVPGPWGEIAGKWWGPRDKRPILGLHGWQDNCGTFDRLAPLLPPDLGFLAIDMPGHGLSGQLPPGIFYHSMDVPIFIRRIVEHFNWPKVSLLAHSLGSTSSFLYTMMFPENVDFLICIDGLFSVYAHKNRQPKNMAKTISNFLKFDKINNSGEEPPNYTFAELEQIWHKGSKESIDLETCKYILQRNTAPAKNNPNRFYITRDPRLKVATLIHLTNEDLIEGAKRITCPLFVCFGTTSMFLQMEETRMELLGAIKKHNANVEYHVIEGTHHLHLNNPENLGDLLNKFIKKYDTENRGGTDFKNKVRSVL